MPNGVSTGAVLLPFMFSLDQREANFKDKRDNNSFLVYGTTKFLFGT
jgi:hypothetical protein